MKYKKIKQIKPNYLLKKNELSQYKISLITQKFKKIRIKEKLNKKKGFVATHTRWQQNYEQ